MAQKPSVPSNIRNRSPWLVQVRSQPSLDKQFPFSAQKKARAYLKNVQAQGRRATLILLETSFQLRVRRQGVRAQFITFDSIEAAEQARLKLESDLSVSIVRDYAAAARCQAT